MKRTTCVVAGVVALTGCGAEPRAQTAPPAQTVPVQRGELSAVVTLNGTLTYRARPDGSPYTAINQARGIYTKLPEPGEEVGCGDVLYRVDERPVRLLCGTVPMYRNLRRGMKGKDVQQLHRNLPGRRSLKVGEAVVLPKAARVAKVAVPLGASARPGQPVVQATSTTLEVQVDLEPAQQGVVGKGDQATVTLPGLKSVPGTVDRIGRVARTAGKDDPPGTATIPASIRLDDPRQARGLDRAPVQVDVTTEGVRDALSVPVTALVGKAGGGFAVEVVRGARRQLVPVKLGLFDTAGGRVQVTGAVRAGDAVVVPSL